jgi:peroxiredoxin
MNRITATLVLVLSFSICAFSQMSLKVGDDAPLFSSTGLDGGSYDLSELRGSVVVLTFWSTRCEICRSEFPKLNRLTDTMRTRNVVFLSLTLDNEAKIESYLRSNRVTSNILPNSFGVLLQYADKDRKGYLDMGFPAYFVVDQQGRIAYRASGWDKTDELSSRVSQLALIK